MSDWIHGFRTIVDITGCERIVWPSSEVELAGAIAARERAMDDQAAIKRVQDLLRQPPRKPTPIKVSNQCEYSREGRRCKRFGSMTGGEYRCRIHAYLP